MQAPAKIIFNPDKKYFLESRMWQGVPSVEKTGKRIWAAFFSGGKYEACIHNYGILAYSDDGENFVDPYLIVAADESIRMRVMDVQLWCEPSGRLWCYWAQDVYNEGIKESDFDTVFDSLYDSFYENVRAFGIYTDNPEAENPMWSEPIYIGDGFIRNRPTPLYGGKIFVPGYMVKLDTYVGYMLTDDISKGAKSVIGPRRLGNKGFDEPMAVVQNDGSVRLLTRTDKGYIAEAYSHDNGESFTDMVPTDIENPCTRFFIRRLSNGMQLLINTPSSKLGNRRSLVAYLSEDDGMTWFHSLVIDSRAGTTYPDAVEDEDGFIYMIHDVQRDNRQLVDKSDPTRSDAEKAICLSRFTVADILAGKVVTEGSYLAKTISRVDYDSRALGHIEGRY